MIFIVTHRNMKYTGKKIACEVSLSTHFFQYVCVFGKIIAANAIGENINTMISSINR